ncbi:nitrogen fixation protein NifW [Thiohalocapsa halophila]|uniref:Nitrogenase-stabilizing/protective protein NifW n=1 Tax=Thiohalocapsa halophila TaxID=69359 RepID=A0ABS1CG87_9GAMM|nr:nitrogenase-stabilizing/protective protein NifW [Thiohalocapsa halophila]MBK1630932.1 nitrogen fixation protein NifW [Thiohalocapsa halophila]
MTATAIPPQTLDDFEDALEELESAEDFLTFFAVPYDPAVVHVNRLHILQRFHDYLDAEDETPAEPTARFERYAALLTAAYQDFVASDARTEKVFAVFRMHEPRTVSVGLDELLAARPKTSDEGPADHAS